MLAVPSHPVSILAIRIALANHGTVLTVAQHEGELIAEMSAISINLPATLTVGNAQVELSLSAEPLARPKAHCEGTIFSQELADCAVETLLNQLGPQVISAKRLPFKGDSLFSGRFLLAFPTSIPADVRLSSGLCLSVRPWVRMPLRCRKCKRYGHHEQNCKDPEVCGNCGQVAHGDSTCAPCCPACAQAHAITDPACPVYIAELAAKRLSATDNISRVEALRRLPSSSQPLRPASSLVPAPPATNAWPLPSGTRLPHSAQTQPAASQNEPALASLLQQQMIVLQSILEAVKRPPTPPPPPPQSQDSELLTMIRLQNDALKSLSSQNECLTKSIKELADAISQSSNFSLQPSPKRKTPANRPVVEETATDSGEDSVDEAEVQIPPPTTSKRPQAVLKPTKAPTKKGGGKN